MLCIDFSRVLQVLMDHIQESKMHHRQTVHVHAGEAAHMGAKLCARGATHWLGFTKWPCRKHCFGCAGTCQDAAAGCGGMM